jgi:CHAT domain-containing protein/predicted negative regulator of RcsB-dependent stress response
LGIFYWNIPKDFSRGQYHLIGLEPFFYDWSGSFLRKAGVWVFGLLVLIAVSATAYVPRFFGRTRASQTTGIAAASPFAAELRKGDALFAQAQYIRAAEIFDRLSRAAQAAHDYSMAVRAGANAGACHFALHQYQPALESFLRARRVLESLGDANNAAVADANIASLYDQMGDTDSGIRWLDAGIQRLSGDGRRLHLAEMLIQRGDICAQSGQMAEAVSSYREGIEAAAAAGDWKLYANGCNSLGEAYFIHRDYAAAEPALLEAYRVGKLRHLPMDSSYRILGRLRLAQGDLVSASALLDRAVELASLPTAITPIWKIYHARGLVREAQGRMPEALDDLGNALRLARAFRALAPGAETARIGAESKLDEVYAAFIDVGNRLYERTRAPRLASETFRAAEENRAASLRAQVSGGGLSGDLPPSYWEAVERLRRAEAAALESPDARRRRQVEDCRAELTRIEASTAAPPEPSAEDLLARISATLPADAVFFSFRLGESASWLWAVDRDGMVLYRLPPQDELQRKTAAALEPIRQDKPGGEAASAGLYDGLFGGVAPRFLGKARWILSLDKSLFDVPFAALVERVSGRPAYVAERHVIQITPGAGYWVDAMARRGSASSSGRFLGIGDPIYNAADSRLPSRSAGRFRWARWLRPNVVSAATPATLSLPRLPASAGELDSCARAWGGPSTLLEGAWAARAELAAALNRDPEIIHFATHFLESSAPQRERAGAAGGAYGLIALSLDGQGETELLTPIEIAHWRTRAELVVLSGCHSDAGRVLPGAGLLGLTRAWLTAGARSVAGSRWDTPDESGALFAALYRELRSQPTPDPALALASAQREMIRSGGWRARPRYWGAYFMVGNE